MDTTTLLIIIGASVLFVIILLITFSIISGKRKSKKLDENLKKIRNENESFDNDNRITLPDDDYLQEKKESVSEEKGAVVEDYVPETLNDREIKEEIKEQPFNNNDLNFDMNNLNTKENDLDFDKFMNEHSYSRKIFNKPILDKIKSLPPDVRMLLLSNILDKHDN